MSPPVDSPPTEFFRLGDFPLENGQVLVDAKVAYNKYGELNSERSNAIVFPTWFVGSNKDSEWLIGPGRALDTDEYCVIVPHMFGNSVSTSPSNASDQQRGPNFPRIDIRDNVRAQHELVVGHIGVREIQLVIGGSMGAFQAYQWALSYSDIVRRFAACCGASRVSGHCYVFLEGVKAALLADEHYVNGAFAAKPERGLRAVGRVYAGWGLSQSFYAERRYEDLGFSSIEGFLVGFWEEFFLGVDPQDMLSQVQTWQHADLALTPGYNGDIDRALGSIEVPGLLMPAARDLYFPAYDMEAEAAKQKLTSVSVIPGVWGHLSESGLDEACSMMMAEQIRVFLNQGWVKTRKEYQHG